MTWTWWMTLLTIFAALVLIGCIPVGVDARYYAEGVFLAAKLGPIRLQLLPQKPKKKKNPKKRKRRKKRSRPISRRKRTNTSACSPNMTTSADAARVSARTSMPMSAARR